MIKITIKIMKRVVASYVWRSLFWPLVLLAFAPSASAQGLGGKPRITQQPLPVIFTSPGNDVLLQVTAAASVTPLRFQWQQDGIDLPGATNRFLTLTNVTLAKAGIYHVIVRNAAAPVISSNAFLNIVQIQVPSVSVGADATLRALIRGELPLSTQWRFNGADITGATKANLTLTSVQAADAGKYSLAITTPSGSAIFDSTLDVDATFTKITTGELVKPVPVSGVLSNYPDGCAWADLNNDGYLDLAVWNLNTADPSQDTRLFLNNRDGTFSPVPRTAIPLVSDSRSISTWADFDRDGYVDLLVSRIGKAQLLRNNHDSSFGPLDAGQVTSDRQVLSSADSGAMNSAWADYDNDGWLDVFLNTSLYRNNGDGTFTNITGTALGPDAAFAAAGRIWGDYDNDGYPDVFVVNYFHAGPNRLYHNNGNGTLTESASIALVDRGVDSYASGWGDYDNDGFLDLFVANADPSQGNFLYHNNGDGTFSRNTAFDRVSPPNVGTYGCAWGDYDNDGFLDLFLSNYGTPNNATPTVNLLYHNNGDGTFTPIRTGSLANDRDAFAGCSWADYNNDGFLDLFVTSQNGHNLLYRNNGNGNSWITFKLVGKASNRDGIGAKVRVNAVLNPDRNLNPDLSPARQLREITGGDGNDNSQPLLANFGLGRATNIDTVRIEWPSGIVQEMHNVAPKQFLTVTEEGVAIVPRLADLLVGSSYVFTAKATFAGALRYQWQFNGADIPGETNLTFAVANATALQAGEYSVVVRDARGALLDTSSPALLRSPGEPIITVQPQSQIVAADQDVTLTVGTVPNRVLLTYLWFRDGVQLQVPSLPTLLLTNAQPARSGNYSVVVSNAVGSVTSAVATLVIIKDTSVSGSLGANVTLRLNTGGSLITGIQWRFNGRNIPGATLANYVITNAQPANVGQYSVVVNTSFGSFTNFSAPLIVDPTFTKVSPDNPIVSASGNGAWGDYDNDGFLDMVVARSGIANLLFHNNGDGTFTQITKSAVVAAVGSSDKIAWGDYDNDGLLDLLVNNTTSTQNQGVSPFLFHNTGNGTFTRISRQPPADDAGNWDGIAWADYDNDGFLDVLLTGGDHSHLYRSDHGTNFVLIGTGPIATEPPNAFNPLWGDYDNDGFVDLFIMSTFGSRDFFLYHNNQNGTFTKNTGSPIADSREARPFGAAWGDYDNDGFLDLFVANAATECFLYHNNGDGTFTKVTSTAIPADPGGGSFDAVWGDYDNDGFLDLYVARGRTDAKNALYHNNGDGTFTLIATGSPVSDGGMESYGCSMADYDNDGFPDLFSSNGNGNNALYRNNGNANNWIKFKLAGALSNRAAIGAKVRVQATIRQRTMWQLREISTGDGRNDNGLRADFGLGDAKVAETVRIEWPSGIVQEMHNVAPKQFLTVTEPVLVVGSKSYDFTGGADFTFNLITNLTSVTSIQWLFNGTELAGETNSVLSVRSAGASSVGKYTVRVTLPNGDTVESNSGVLKAPVPPGITSQPASLNLNPGETATFQVAATGSAPLEYQWRLNAAVIEGATSSTLVVANVEPANVGDYAVEVRNAAGSVVSTNATLSLIGAAAMASQPKDQSVSLGADVTFSVGAAGTPPFAYQWRLNGAEISGATNRTLMITNVSLANSGQRFSVVVRNSLGSATSRESTVEVDPTFTKIIDSPFVKAHGGGVYWGDYDNDGNIDLYVTTFRDPANLLFRNNGDGTFTRITSGNALVDEKGTIETFAPDGGSWVDYDNDGWLDILAGNGESVNPLRNLLYHNNGNGGFTKITSSPLVSSVGYSGAPAWGDFDNDGNLDVFISYAGEKNGLYRNKGKGIFERVITGDIVNQALNTDGIAWGDYDNDGDLDLVIADAFASRNYLYRNDGDGTFTRLNPFASPTSSSWGCNWADYDNDGYLDVIINNYGGKNALFHNNGDGSFTRVLSGPLVNDVSGGSNGFAFGDYDNDGWLDIFVANFTAKDYLYHNNGDGTFTRVTTGSIANEFLGDGSTTGAWGDYNNDGFLDLAVSRAIVNNALYLNNGNANNWIKLKLVGTISNRGAIGAKVRVQATIGGKTFWQLQELSGGSGWGAQNDVRPNFGLGDATLAETVRIEWPSFIVQELHNVAAKQFLTVTEPNITIEPKKLELDEGKDLSFDVSTDLTDLTSIQWQFNGANLAGQTNATLVITNASEVNLGKYAVIVNTARGEQVTSAAALLVLPGPPVITAQPQNRNANAGDTINFEVTATGAPPLSYQWRLEEAAIEGATNALLTLLNVQPINVGNYTVVITNRAGKVTSDAAALNLIGAPAIGTQPKNASVSLGATVIFRVIASGTRPLSYQWLSNDMAIAGATLDRLVLSNAVVDFAASYRVVVNNTLGTVSSFPARLDVDPTFTKITTGPIVTEKDWFGGGATWGDYDNDGFIDLFVGQSEDSIGSNRLYHNNGDGTFTRTTASTVGPIASLHTSTRGTVWGDYDNDGFLDMFVSNFSGKNFLFRNLGNGTFEQILTGQIATDTGDSRGAAWGDFDNDGYLDLFVPHGEDHGRALYRNNGDSTFSRVAADNLTADRAYSIGSSWGDYNNDGLLDLFVANYFPERGTASGPNFLYLNRGAGLFEKVTTGSIVTDRSGSTGCAWGDFDNDGFLDLFVANNTADSNGEKLNFLYHNNGDGTFMRLTDASVGPIVTDPAQGWDCAWADYDNDGYLDLFVANPEGPKNALYHNKGDGSFERITIGSLANDQSSAGYGSASCTWGDYDNDGFLDLFVGDNTIHDSTTQPNYLYRNNGNNNGWLKLKLVGTQSNRAAIGAKVRVLATINGNTFSQLREISGGGGYRSQNGLLPHFGLGDATVADTVRIEWPSGTVQEFHNVAAKQFLTITEPPQLTAPILNADGSVQFNLIGAVRIAFNVEASNDLVNWAPLTVITNKSRIEVITDRTAPATATRFYRATGPGPTPFPR